MSPLPARSRLVVLLALPLALGPLRAAPPATVTIAHGELSQLGEGNHKLALLRLWGTPYEMGYAHGRLCADTIRRFYNRVILAMSLGMGTPPTALDAVWQQMAPFVSDRMQEELRGLADGAGVPLRDVQRAHVIPDLSEFHCTFYAAWGSATSDGHLRQIRALDYATQAGLQEAPALIVYEPRDRHRVVVVGWLGFAGAVTGMSDQQLALSEIGDHFSDEVETLAGEPMPFLMRRVLEESDGLDDAVARFQQAHRTSSLLYCVGDGKIPAAKALRTCHDFCQVYGPADHGALSLPEVVFWSMGCDSKWNDKVHDTLATRLGRIDDATGRDDVMRGLRTGNLHAVAFDLTTLELWVANATPAPQIQPAYTQPFVHFRPNWPVATRRQPVARTRALR